MDDSPRRFNNFRIFGKTVKRTLLTVLCVSIGLSVTHVALAPFGAGLIVDKSDSMAPTVRAGDALLVFPIQADHLHIGDVVTLNTDSRGSVTHRVASLERTTDGLIVTTKGDANNADDEQQLIQSQSSAQRLVLRIPYLGYGLFFLKLPVSRVLLAGAILAVGFGRRSRISDVDSPHLEMAS